MTPPLRFLLLVIGGWVAARAAVLAFMAPSAPVRSTRVEASALQTGPGVFRPFVAVPVGSPSAWERPAALLRPVPAPTSPTDAPAIAHVRERLVRASKTIASSPKLLALAPAPPANVVATLPVFAAVQGSPVSTFATAMPVPADRPAVGPRTGTDRLSGSAWFLARGGDSASGVAVAGGGLLGASQAGARMLYRVNDAPAAPVSLSARLSSPLRSAGAEAAVGVEWQPVAGVPVRLLAERRQRVSGDGRSAWALLAYGGIGDVPVAAGFALDAYAQAGVVGARRRDLFADGGATLVRPVAGAVAVGAGAWGGVQPGAARLDVGPRVTAVLDAAGGRARVSLDWRFRVAGDAAPASGPSLTVATGF